MFPEGSGSVSEQRIILVGKTGAGKSSAGNTILGREAFDSELSPTSVTSECKKERGEVGGRRLAVIDTPGLFDTKLISEDVLKKIKVCIGMCSPGPHAFLVIIQLGRFTEEEKETVKMIQQHFGEDASKYTMVLFTHGDQLGKKSIEEFVSESEELQAIIHNCHSRYHVFNNNTNHLVQTTQLLDKIDQMIRENGGSHYTTDMFRRAEETIEKEKQRLLKEAEAQREKELQELKNHYNGEMLKLKEAMLKEKHEAIARAHAEKNNEVHHHHHILCVIC